MYSRLLGRNRDVLCLSDSTVSLDSNCLGKVHGSLQMDGLQNDRNKRPGEETCLIRLAAFHDRNSLLRFKRD